MVNRNKLTFNIFVLLYFVWSAASSSAPQLTLHMRSQQTIANINGLAAFASVPPLPSFFANFGIVQTLNSFYALKKVFSQAETSLGESHREAETARIRLEEAEAAMRAAQAAEAEAIARAEEVQHRAELEVKTAEKTLDEIQRQAKLAVDAAEEKLKKVETELLSRELELHTVTIQVRGAEERAENAEEVARRSDARASAMEEEVRKAKEEVAEAKRSASNAVAIYRESPAYNLDLADATAFSYDLGFRDCKLKVKQIFHIDGVENIEPDILGDLPSSSSSEEGTAPTEP